MYNPIHCQFVLLSFETHVCDDSEPSVGLILDCPEQSGHYILGHNFLLSKPIKLIFTPNEHLLLL